jgi:CheY-like chemotaxis protein
MQKKVLLVEDNEDDRDLVSFVLKSSRLNVELLTAENGEEGLALAFKHIPDLILMDMQLPVMDGWDAVPILRSDTRTESIPIVALTAQAKPEDKRKTKEIGCIEYMSKPIMPDELLALVKIYLQI